MQSNKKNMFFSNTSLQRKLAALSEARSISPFSLLSSPKKVNETQTFEQVSAPKRGLSIFKGATSSLTGLNRRRSSVMMLNTKKDNNNRGASEK